MRKSLDLSIIVESVSEPGDASTPAGYISRRMMQVISTWYSKNLAIEVKKGMQKKVENGGWPNMAPFGYLNKHDKNSSWIEVDPKNGSLLTQAFQEFGTGKWTLEEWAGHTYSMGYRSTKGNRIGKSPWSAIFHNRFYLGETWLKKGDVPVKGTHQPLVSESEFAAVQKVLREHDKHKQRTQRHKYLLRGLLYSLDANSPCWSETHAKKRISYYRSKDKTDNGAIFYDSRVIEEQLPAIYAGITITEKARQSLKQELSDWFDSETSGNGELKQAEARLTKLERMEKNLQRLAIEEEISFMDFKEHRSRIEAERARLTNTIDVIKQRQHLVKADFEVALQLASELEFLFNRGTFDEKRLLCETVFKRLYVKEGKVTKVELNSPFAIIASRAKGAESVLNGGR